ncbi:MAG: CopD family protein [Acidobacteriia bacterium]|nr:CopD family protein [Terriglobia bacterium]
MVAWTLVVHIFGLVFWVSGLLVSTVVLSRHTQETAVEAREALAGLEKIFLRGIADPGALLTLLAGIVLVLANKSYYLHARWLHIKLALVVLLIVLHWIVGTRCKLFAAGRISLQRRQVNLLLGAIVLVFILILISTLPGEVFLT